MRLSAAVLAAALLAGCAAQPARAPAAAEAAAPAGPVTIRYGEAPSQRVELFLPAGRGPFPVVAFIHGGCYRASVANLADARPAFAELARRGIAVWGVGYRRVDEPGGPYPGMYQDVGAAIDRLRAEAPRRRLDLKRFVVAGHSAGGHLALWAAGRGAIPAASPLHTARPLLPRAVVAVAGPGDLAPLAAAADQICGPGTAVGVMGAADRPDRFADISPAALAPLRVPTTLIVGDRDTVVPPAFVQAYAAAAIAKGDRVETRVLPGVDHMQVVTPGQPAFDAVAGAIARAAG